MRHYLLSLFLLSTYLIFCQKIRPNFHFLDSKQNDKIFTSVFSFPSDTSLSVFYLYSIPVNTLIFIKNGESFSSDVQITLEVKDSSASNIQRYFSERKISYDSFETTVDPSVFAEGIINFNLPNANLILRASYLDVNSNKEIFIKEEYIKYEKANSFNYLNPIILNEKTILCDSIRTQQVTNFGRTIPFSNNLYDILIPSLDLNITQIYVKVVSGRDTVFNSMLNSRNISAIRFTECDDKIIIKTDSTLYLANNFYLQGLSQRFKEGPLEIILSETDDFTSKKVLRTIVKWIDKPKSLLDPENAIKLLKFIIGEDSVYKLLKSGDNYDSILTNYWKASDPSPQTEYNELMAEYYQRIDFVNENFSTITGMKGLNSDRGRIYVLYGKPGSIQRLSNIDGKVSEVWNYQKLNKQFIFVDERGTGNFILKDAK